MGVRTQSVADHNNNYTAAPSIFIIYAVVSPVANLLPGRKSKVYYIFVHVISYTERRARALIQSHERKGVAALAPECRQTRVLDDILQQLSGTL